MKLDLRSLLAGEIRTQAVEFDIMPLSEKYFSFAEAERAGCAAVAERDVRAALLDTAVSAEDETMFVNAAIAEQTVFLLLNPEYLTGMYTRISALASAGESKKFSASQLYSISSGFEKP